MDITPFLVKLAAISAVIGGIWLKIKILYKNLSPILESFIKDVEQRAQDGLINRNDRKELVMTLIREAQEHGQLKQFGIFEKIIVSKIVDYIAEKLPDFKFTVKPPDNA